MTTTRTIGLSCVWKFIHLAGSMPAWHMTASLRASPLGGLDSDSSVYDDTWVLSSSNFTTTTINGEDGIIYPRILIAVGAGVVIIVLVVINRKR